MANMFDAAKSKLLNKLKETKFLKELREYDSLIKSIGECKSKSEEDRIILAEIETLKQRLNDPKLDKTRGREYMVRLIYCEMLGHDVSWAYVKAVQLASEPNILTKKAAYLALTQFFDQNHELVLLLVNTLLSDLKNDNFINVGTALVVCTKLIGPDLINAVYPLVIDRLKHPKEHVRKKAIMALHRFYQLDPRREGPLAGLEIDKHLRTMLCDKDPGVMSAALCALHDVIKGDPAPYKNLIPSFTSILKQVAEHRLPKSYDYHRFPAPFIQIKLLKILALLGSGDRVSSENMYTVIHQTMKRANGSHTIGNAILFECVTTITTIFPNPHLISAAADVVATFLRSPSHNLRYVGVDALAGIIKINPQAAQEHQLAVVDCLEDPDDTLKLKTLELLYKMTKANNVEVIVDRMVSYLRTATDEHIKRDITRKVSELAERYAPSPAWFIKTVSDVCELGGDHVESTLAHSLTRLIAEQDTDLHRSAVEQYSKLLDVPVGRNLPDVLLQVMVWVLGEYGVLLSTSTVKPVPVQQLMSKLVSLITRQKSSEEVKELLLPALAKLAVQGNTTLPPDVEAWVNKANASQDVEMQQRAYELQALLTAPQQVQSSVLPHDASCEEFDDTELANLRELNFLSWYVSKALQSGAAPYIPPEQRQPIVAAISDRAGAGGALRFQAYESHTASSTPKHGHTSSQGTGDFFGDAGFGAPAGAAAASASGQPQLHAANKSRPNRWGPAQFEQPAQHGSAAAAAKPASAAQSHQPASGRDLLAASLFSGGAGRTGALAAAGMDLLSLDDPASPKPAAAAAPAKPAAAAGGLDLLMDFGASLSPPAAPAAARPTAAAAPLGGTGGLDLLLGDLGPMPQVPNITQPPAAMPAMPALGGFDALSSFGMSGLPTQPAASTSKPAGGTSGDLLGGLGGGLGVGGMGMSLSQGPPQPALAGLGLGLGTSVGGVGQAGQGGISRGGVGMASAGQAPSAAAASVGLGAFSGLAQAQMSSMAASKPKGQAMAGAPGFGAGAQAQQPAQQACAATSKPATTTPAPVPDIFADLI